MKIGVDVDGTVTEMIAPMAEFLCGRGFDVPSYEETMDYDLGTVWGCSREEALSRVNLFYNSEDFGKLTPMEGVVESFERLFPPHEGCVITVRPKFVEQITRNFFNRYLDGRCNGFYHLGRFEGEGLNETKGSLAKKLGIDIFVEDALHQAEEITSYGIPVLMINHPWNAGRTVPSLVRRVDGWKNVVSFLESYKK